MMFPRKQRVILLTLLYCCTAALICGVWSTAFPRRFGESLRTFEEPRLVSGDDDTAILSSSEIWTAGARSLTSTDDSAEETQAKPQTSETSEDDLQSTLPQLYHLPQIFTLNYDEMTKNLRVFLYPNSQTGSMNDSYEYDITNGNKVPADALFSEESTTTDFFNLLKNANSFVTTDPDEAQLFFLPVSIDALHSALGPDGVGNHLRHYIQSIRDDYTFWDRSLGADHFYLASHGYETVNHRNNLELTKNAVQVACSPLAPSQAFYPHKDIVLPHYLPSNPTISSPRSKLAYINSDLATSALLPQEWKTDSDFLIETEVTSNPSLSSSKFCISLSMRNVVDALRHGCVPVLVSDSIIYDLPFQDILNWHEFSVVIGTEEMADVKNFLTSMSAAKYAKMQYLGLQASKHMEWNNPPAAYDAFHMTMFELWMRRHSVKYARRSETS